MSGILKIKVNIANRIYPLTINSPSEEEGMRKAANKINSLIAKFERDYAVKDKQDVLAMCALQYASAIEIKDVDNQEIIEKALNKLTKLYNDVQDITLD